MRDCANAAMRDLLPELMHGRLRGDALEQVRAHVSGCADCRAELELLERLRAAVPAPQVDAAAVVAALPPYRAPSLWQRAWRSPAFRAAAAVVLVAGGVTLARGVRPDAIGDADSLARAASVAGIELAIGETFQDLSDSDLAEVIDILGKLEAVTPDVDDIVLPIGQGSE